MATPPVRDNGIFMIANTDLCVKSPEDRARRTTTTTFTEHLLENIREFSDAFEVFFSSNPLTSHPLGQTMILQVRFFTSQFQKMVEAQDKLLEELEATQIALAQKDEALMRVLDLHGKSQTAVNQMTATPAFSNLNPSPRPGRGEGGKSLAQKGGYNGYEESEWI
ncbi:hypothetical protein CDV36_014475 [Fusarium kuroshium]|uniref:Uncharacterized protein n=2 Tax=Fusarium solani species complex TaxID=232080 RepID=A0A3M2RI04_9HYPO|nr:hypothetical protein CDV36_014475 [Fusarium kuroshium]RSL58929.1 hypothetical protein CEP51_013998 [Fusarium floridanum]